MDEKKELRTKDDNSIPSVGNSIKNSSKNLKTIKIDKNSLNNNNFIKDIIAQSSNNNKENSKDYDFNLDSSEKEYFKFPNGKNKNMNITIKKSNNTIDKTLFLNDYTFYENKSKKVNDIISKYVLKNDEIKFTKIDKNKEFRTNIKFELTKKKNYGSTINNPINTDKNSINKETINKNGINQNNPISTKQQTNGVFSFLKKLIFGAEVEEKMSDKSSIYSDQISKDSKILQKDAMSNISTGIKNDENILINFLPCMMCGEIVNINFVEEHSDKCNGNYDEYQRYDTKYSINNDSEKKVSSSNFKSIKNINNKLIKIYDHVQTLGNFKDENTKNNSNSISSQTKDSHLLFLLSQSIKDTAFNDDYNYSSISSLKKILINIDVSLIFIKSQLHIIIKVLGVQLFYLIDAGC